MMKSSPMLPVVNDAELVGASMAGDRDAFGHIVARYQSLVCSLAYSATGSLGQSEDLAQETFITAWKHLGHLREREKLRSWLCGIARNRINNFLRREGRNPIRASEPLEEVAGSLSPEPLPPDHVITQEEEALLWRALECIPPNYREPLVLYYRERKSIETVAANLDLTEDAVHQRLSRGRKMLQEQIAAFVEGTLERTNPGKAFTISVLAALPATLTFSAKAATLGAAAKGASAKAAGGMGFFGMLLGPLMIFFGNWLGYRIGIAEAGSDTERQYVNRFYRRIGICTAMFFAVFAGLIVWLCHERASGVQVAVLLVNGLIAIYLLVTFGFVLATTPARRRYYAQVHASEKGTASSSPAFEFRTRAALLGLPLIHVRIGDRFDILHKPVRAWIAVGNYATGGLFAFGGVAIAPVSIGFCAIGLLPFGGLAVGACALGGFALGGWAMGALAVGWQAVGCFAVAWHAAAGSLAFAHDYATGMFVRAAQVNNDMARNAIENWFYRGARAAFSHSIWLNLLWVAPLFVQWRLIARKNQRHSGQQKFQS